MTPFENHDTAGKCLTCSQPWSLGHICMARKGDLSFIVQNGNGITLYPTKYTIHIAENGREYVSYVAKRM